MSVKKDYLVRGKIDNESGFSTVRIIADVRSIVVVSVSHDVVGGRKESSSNRSDRISRLKIIKNQLYKNITNQSISEWPKILYSVGVGIILATYSFKLRCVHKIMRPIEYNFLLMTTLKDLLPSNFLGNPQSAGGDFSIVRSSSGTGIM